MNTCGEVKAKFRALSVSRMDDIQATCTKAPEECVGKYKEVLDDKLGLLDRMSKMQLDDSIPLILRLDLNVYRMQLFTEVSSLQQASSQIALQARGMSAADANWLSTVVAAASGMVLGPKGTGKVLEDVATNIHPGQQGKHILGNNNFIPGRSSINSDIDPQKLLDGVHNGSYPVVGTGSRGQPVVDFGRPIGVDGTTGLSTNFGTIHSGKSGAHIVPTNPTTIGGGS
jgi:filamentous hemagglutinin